MDFTQTFPVDLNIFIFTQKSINVFSFAQISLNLLDHTQMLPFYSNVSNFTQNLNEVF